MTLCAEMLKVLCDVDMQTHVLLYDAATCLLKRKKKTAGVVYIVSASYGMEKLASFHGAY